MITRRRVRSYVVTDDWARGLVVETVDGPNVRVSRSVDFTSVSVLNPHRPQLVHLRFAIRCRRGREAGWVSRVKNSIMYGHTYIWINRVRLPILLVVS